MRKVRDVGEVCLLAKVVDDAINGTGNSALPELFTANYR